MARFTKRVTGDVELDRVQDAIRIAFESLTAPQTPIVQTVIGTLNVTTSGGTVTVSLPPTGVIPGSYTNTNLTVDVYGRITLASNGAGGGGITQLTGDVTAGPGPGSQAATLAATAVTPGSYTYGSFTVDAKGRLTAASSGAAPQPLLSLTNKDVLYATGASTVGQDGGFQYDTATGLQTVKGVVVGGVAGAITFSAAFSSSIAKANGTLIVGTTTSDQLQLQTNTTTAILVGSLGDVSLPLLTTNGHLKTSGGTGFVSVDTTTYLSTVTLTGDVTGSGGASFATTLAASGVTAGSYTNLNATIDAKGRITAASNGSGGSGITQLTGDGTAGPGTGSQVLTITGLALSKLASIATQTVLGNGSGGAAAPVALTISAANGLVATASTLTNTVLTGVAGGQTWVGGTAAGNGVTVSTTSNATKGSVTFGSSTGLVYNEATGVLTSGIATPAVGTVIHAKKDQNAGTGVYINNPNAGGAANTNLGLYQGDAYTGASLSFYILGSAFTTSGFYTASAGAIQLSGGSANLVYNVQQASGDHVFIGGSSTTPTEKFRISSGGTTTHMNAPFVSFTSATTARAQAAGQVMAFAQVPPTQAAAAGTVLDAYKWDAQTITFTGTTGITTAAGVNFIDVEQPTYTDASALTITNAATLVVKGAPKAGGSVTLTNTYAAWFQGGNGSPVRIDGYSGASEQPALILGAASAQAITKSGGTFTIGTTDSNYLYFETNHTNVANFTPTGDFFLNGILNSPGTIQGYGGGASLQVLNASSDDAHVALSASGVSIKGNLYPSAATYTVGTSGSYWPSGYIGNLHTSDLIRADTTGIAIGTVINVDAGVSTGQLQFFGTGGAAQQTGGSASAGGTYGATEQTMLNRVYSAMRAYGLIT